MKTEVKLSKHFNYLYIRYKENETIEIIFNKKLNVYSLKIFNEYNKYLLNIYQLNKFITVKNIAEILVLDKTGGILNISDKDVYDFHAVVEYEETDWEIYLRLKKEFN